MSRSRSLGFLGISGAVVARSGVGQEHTYKHLAQTYISDLMRTSLAVCMGLGSLLALSGCTPIKVKLGMKVYLAKTPVTSIAASLPKGPGIAPGEKLPLVVVVTGTDGKVLQTEGAGKGKVLWKDLNVTATVVTVNQKGIVSLPKDPRISDGKVAHVTTTVPSHPDVSATGLDIPVRYDYGFIANFSGGPGSSGMNGSDGMDGASGSMGSMDPNNPSAGGNGGNGTDGGNGGDGGPGGDAPPVQVRITVKTEGRPLLQVSVAANGKTKFYLVDPAGGSLTIKADGGPGGSGGRGGRGGSGGSGGTGTPNGNSGRNGMDGHDGSSGYPGRGGLITVKYDPAAKPYMAKVRLSAQNGPTPIIQDEPVAPLW